MNPIINAIIPLLSKLAVTKQADLEQEIGPKHRQPAGKC